MLKLLATTHAVLVPLVILSCLLATPARADLVVDVGGRSVNVHVPPSYSEGTPMPVVMLRSRVTRASSTPGSRRA